MEVNNLLIASSAGGEAAEAEEEEDNDNKNTDGAITKREQQQQEPSTPTSTIMAQQSTTITATGTPLSPFGIEPGVCLKNVAAIITQQHHQLNQQQQQSPCTPKELPSEVRGGTKEKADFHFDKHSQFTGICLSLLFLLSPPETMNI